MKLYRLLFFAVIILLFACTEKKIEDRQIDNTASPDTTEYLFYGFILSIDDAGDYISISADTIQFYLGEEAKKQFESDRDTEFNDMFYIRNQTEDSLKFILANDVKIITQTFTYDEYGNFEFNKEMTIDDFLSFINSDTSGMLNYIPFELLVKNNRVIKIKEIYIP